MTQPDDPKHPDKSSGHMGQSTEIPKPVSVAAVATGGVKQPRQVTSEYLLHGDREVQIIHGDEIYRLSVTRQGKLILHK